MTESNYAVTVAHLGDHGSLHPYEHMFFNKIQEEQTDIILEIMTELSLRKGLKEPGTKAYNTVHSDTNQINSRNMFKPMH